MVVDDFNLMGVASGKSETDPILIIDPDGVLAAPITTQFFQSVAGWEFEIIEGGGGPNKTKFSKSRRLQSSRQFPVSLIVPQTGGMFAGEIFDHRKLSIERTAIYIFVKQI